MPPTVVVHKQVRAGGTVRERREPLGAVFAPVPGATRPVYAFGSPQRAAKDVLFTCPVSAIPDVVWQLLEDWRSCRAMRCLPVAGGWVDQPLLVRRAFPVFEAEMRAWEAARASGAEAQTSALIAALKARL